MVIYIDRSAIPEVENIPDKVFKYLLEKARPEAYRLRKLYDAYLGRIEDKDASNDKTDVNINYGKYVVDILRRFYLGEPLKYDNNDTARSKKQVVVNKKGALVDAADLKRKDIDISAVIDAYDEQIISKVDSKIGKYIGIFGSCQELLYASEKDIPKPKSAVLLPFNCILVKDNTVEHNDIFFMTYEERERVSGSKYYSITVYTDKTQKIYESKNLEGYTFSSVVTTEHYFGRVPCVNYDNNDERQGDIEQIIPLSEAYSKLMSDRLTDKSKFIDSVLVLFGASLDEDDDAKALKENKFIDGLPTDARLEYIQKVFDESSVKVLGDDLVRDIHKLSQTVDMSDESFSGNITGVALLMKFMPMSYLAKEKIINITEGLKKRFEMYNYWLNIKDGIPIVPSSDIDIIFSVDIPQNLLELVEIVERLEGRVDEQTLLSLLPFVKDPAEMVEIMEEKNAEKRNRFLDSFGNAATADKDENDNMNQSVTANE